MMALYNLDVHVNDNVIQQNGIRNDSEKIMA